MSDWEVDEGLTDGQRAAGERLDALAERLGVEPADAKSGGIIITIAESGSYDMLDLLHAFLDRLAEFE